LIQKILPLQYFFQYREMFEDFGMKFPLWFYLVLIIVLITAHVISGGNIRKKIKYIFLFSIGFPFAYWLVNYIIAYKEVITYIQKGLPLKPWILAILNAIWLMFSPLLLISSLFFLLFYFTPKIIEFLKPEEYDETTDPWHPQNNKIKISKQLSRALNADLSKDNITNIVTVLENGITDLNVQKSRMRLLKENWQTISPKPDKGYYGGNKREDLFSQNEIGKFIRTYNRRMFKLDEYLKECHEVYNKVQFEAPKQRGMSQPKDIDDFDGINTTFLEDLE